MPHKNQYHCPICGADFKDSRALRDHEKEHHTQPGVGAERSNERRDSGGSKRKDRTFERRNWE